MGKGIFAGLKLKDKILLTFVASAIAGEKILDEFNRQFPSPRDVIKAANGYDPDLFKSDKPTSLERAFFRILDQKYLEKEERDRENRYKISDKGWNYLYKKFPQLRFKQKSFDGFWRVVVYDIEEADRKLRGKIRSGLKLLGFRMIQQSVWASPYDWEEDIDDLFRKLGINERALVLKSKIPRRKTEFLLKTFWGSPANTFTLEGSPIGNLLVETLPAPLSQPTGRIE